MVARFVDGTVLIGPLNKPRRYIDFALRGCTEASSVNRP
jgi:hypothetical protein